MARQSRSRPAARSAPAPAPAQSRSHTTAAAAPPAAGYGHAPSAHPPAPPQVAQGQTREPGMMAQMAANVGSVAAGSVIGHGISRALFGGSESAAPPVDAQAQAPAPVQAQASEFQQTTAAGVSCEVQAKNFTQCLEKADFPSCTWYFEQLKACQAAAAPY